MDPMDLQSILQAFPARTKLLVIAAELPDGTADVRVLEPDGNAGGANGANGVAATAPPPDLPAGGGALERLQRLIASRGNVPLKPREWAHATGLSARELRRAIDADALPHAAKADGRDHGARLVTADALLAYVATVAAVERGQLPAPRWWAAVRGKRATAA